MSRVASPIQHCPRQTLPMKSGRHLDAVGLRLPGCPDLEGEIVACGGTLGRIADWPNIGDATPPYRLDSGPWTLDPGPTPPPRTHTISHDLSSLISSHFSTRRPYATLLYTTLDHTAALPTAVTPPSTCTPQANGFRPKTGHHPPSYCTSYCTSYSSVWLFSPIHSLEPRYQTQACGAPVLLRTSPAPPARRLR